MGHVPPALPSSWARLLRASLRVCGRECVEGCGLSCPPSWIGCGGVVWACGCGVSFWPWSSVSSGPSEMHPHRRSTRTLARASALSPGDSVGMESTACAASVVYLGVHRIGAPGGQCWCRDVRTFTGTAHTRTRVPPASPPALHVNCRPWRWSSQRQAEGQCQIQAAPTSTR